MVAGTYGLIVNVFQSRLGANRFFTRLTDASKGYGLSGLSATYVVLLQSWDARQNELDPVLLRGLGAGPIQQAEIIDLKVFMLDMTRRALSSPSHELNTRLLNPRNKANIYAEDLEGSFHSLAKFAI